MYRLIIITISLSIFCSCSEDLVDNESSITTLEELINVKSDLEHDDLIACAAGNDSGDFGSTESLTSVFFYPEKGAFNFRYFEAISLSDSVDYSKYLRQKPAERPVFNGYLRRFELPIFEGERMSIVTYQTEGKLHISDPIRLKTNEKQTQVSSALLTVTPSGINPSFAWQDGEIAENVIYFQVVSTADGDFISGTYTYEKNFTFYELGNVVLNVTDTTTAPTLLPSTEYRFTMMAVSEDNWVNLLIEKDFETE